MDDSPGPEPVDDESGAVGPNGDHGPDASPDGSEGTDPGEPGRDRGDPGAGADAGEDGAGRDPLRFNSWRKRSAAGVVMSGIAVGLQQALELPRQEPAFVIEASGEPEDPNRPIDLKFDPDSPADTVAIIRRPPVAEGPE